MTQCSQTVDPRFGSHLPRTGPTSLTRRTWQLRNRVSQEQSQQTGFCRNGQRGNLYFRGATKIITCTPSQARTNLSWNEWGVQQSSSQYQVKTQRKTGLEQTIPHSFNYR
jgi:hypothetical protein